MRHARIGVAAFCAAAMLGLVAGAGGASSGGDPRSVAGRTLRVFHLGRTAGPTILVFGAVHGDEPAGIAIARDLIADAPSLRSNLWVVPDLNPDGRALRTRQNAHGVDLNRNFPWRWASAGREGDLHYSGPHALSEPEARFAVALILRVHPTVTIWFHQPLALVDESGGSLLVERRFARRVGLPLARLPRYRGSATTWQDHRFPAATAFVVELPPGTLSDAEVERYTRAVDAAAR
jgi:protein MpaA